MSMFTSVSKLHSSCNFLLAFLSNVGCHSAVPPKHGIVCIGLVLFNLGYLSITAIIAALVASIGVCVIVHAIFSAQLSFFLCLIYDIIEIVMEIVT